MIWWLLAVIQLITIAIAVYFGAIDYLLETDGTRISFGITALFVLTTAHIGYVTFKGKREYDPHWFVAESCMALGMIGTMLGFMLMLRDGLSNINPSDVSAMQSMIGSMAYGMSTALITTLAGLISSLAIKVQIMIQDHIDG